MQKRLDCEAAILAAYARCRPKLIFNPVQLNDFEQSCAEYGAKNLRAHVHQGDTLPFVGVAKVPALGNGKDSALAPFVEINLSSPIGIEEVKENIYVLIQESLECVRWDVIKAKGFLVRKFRYRSLDLIPFYRVINSGDGLLSMPRTTYQSTRR